MGLTPASSRGAAAILTHQAFDACSDVSINNGAAGSLRWDGTPSYDTLFSTTVDTAPTAITTGVYAVSVVVASDAPMTVGGYFKVTFGLNNGDDNIAFVVHSAGSIAAQTSPDLLLAATWYIKAGKAVTVQVVNSDGVSARAFNIAQAAVQRIA